MRLRAIRNLVLTGFGLCLLFPIYGVVVMGLVPLLLGEQSGPAVLILSAPYVGYFLFLGSKSWSVICPRCRNTFFRRGIWFGWPTRCNHCLLSIFDSYDESAR